MDEAKPVYFHVSWQFCSCESYFTGHFGDEELQGRGTCCVPHEQIYGHPRHWSFGLRESGLCDICIHIHIYIYIHIIYNYTQYTDSFPDPDSRWKWKNMSGVSERDIIAFSCLLSLSIFICLYSSLSFFILLYPFSAPFVLVFIPLLDILALWVPSSAHLSKDPVYEASNEQTCASL